MKVEGNCYVKIDYTLKLADGEVVDQSDPGDPLGFVYDCGMIVPGLEQALAGMEAGQEASAVVEPEDGYGLRREELLQDIPRDRLPPDAPIEPGVSFEAHSPQGAMSFVISEVKEDVVVADFNHPLAGEKLHFDFKIVEVREPTPKEREMSEQLHSGHQCTNCGKH